MVTEQNLGIIHKTTEDHILKDFKWFPKCRNVCLVRRCMANKITCTKIGSKYQTCLKSSDWMESKSEVKKCVGTFTWQSAKAEKFSFVFLKSFANNNAVKMISVQTWKQLKTLYYACCNGIVFKNMHLQKPVVVKISS